MGLGLRKEFPGSRPPCTASTVYLCCGALAEVGVCIHCHRPSGSMFQEPP